MNVNAALFLALAALFAAPGCAESTPARTATQVTVEIDADPGVRLHAVRLEVRVEGSRSFDELDARTEPQKWPFDEPTFPKHIALVPRDGDTRRAFVLTATAWTDDDQMVVARLVSGYVPNEIRYARIVLEDGCEGARCEGLESCVARSCINARIDPDDLSPDKTHPAMLVPPPDMDAGRDAGRTDLPDVGVPNEGGRDADADAEPPTTNCTDSNYAVACPFQALQEVVGCSSDGDCMYEPTTCPVEPDGCPVYTPQADATQQMNTCVVVANAACLPVAGGSGSCQGATCVPAAELSLTGGIVSGFSGQYGTVALQGSIGGRLPHMPFACAPAGSQQLCLSGGIAPSLHGGVR